MKSKKILMIFATYGIVQVLAQDLGIPSGDKQAKLIRKQPVQLAILYAGAYSVSEDHQIAIISTALYYILKHIYSNKLEQL
tara:strand:- start:617 stop:859 length:243 start_codon:yes stop_codon:yes gene_type:complete